MLFSPFQKPKQKRHRCRNPNKLDINTLTGDERVPVVNKRNGKKVMFSVSHRKKNISKLVSSYSVSNILYTLKIPWDMEKHILLAL